MADLSTASGVNYTNYAAIAANTSGIGEFPDGTNQWGTKLRVMYDMYTVPAGDTIHTDCVLTMGVLPSGAIPLGLYFAQSGGGEAAVATVLVGGTAVIGTNALTDMTSNTEQLLPVISTSSDSALTSASLVTLQFATADVDAATVLVLAMFYISAED